MPTSTPELIMQNLCWHNCHILCAREEEFACSLQR